MKRMIIASKRPIKAAEDVTYEYFSDFAGRAYNVGYDLEVDSDFNVKMTAREDADMMPKIETATHKMNDGTYTFSPVLTFPILDSNNLDYADSLEYWMKKWMEVAAFLTSLIQYEFNPSDFEDEE